MKEMRYAHCDGHTDLCFDSSGRYMLTCGTDGDVRVWDGVEDDNVTSHRVGGRVYCIAFKNGRFFTATDSNSVQANTFPDGLPDGLVTRFTAPVLHMVFNISGSTLVAGSADFTVKVVDMATSIHQVYRGHSAPVLSVALNPDEQLAASASCDGSVQVWRVSKQSLVKSWSLLDKCSHFSLAKTLCRLIWSHDGEFLLVPVKNTIHLYSQKQNWNLVYEFSNPDVCRDINILSLSPDGRHIVAGCLDGVIAVFDYSQRRLVERRRHDNGLSITALVWSPSNHHQIAFCVNEGHLGLLEDIVLPDLILSNIIPPEVSTASSGDNPQHLLDMEDNGGSEDDGDESDSGDLGAIKRKLMPMLNADAVGGSDFQCSTVFKAVDTTFTPTPLQPAFQPGSTPVHLTSRFMRWNDIGIVKQYNAEEENSIDVEFHDTSTHHSMHIANASNFTMADLTSDAVLLATTDDGEGNSRLMCLHFGSWDSAKEWGVCVPDSETIEAVVSGRGWIAVAMSNRIVRLFTIGGVQRSPFNLSGPVVCLSAYKHLLMAVYHAGLGIPGDQCMSFMIVDVVGERGQVLAGSLPLSSCSTLSWAGFSAEGTPLTMDSEGIVRMVNTGLASTWTHVANTRQQMKGKSDYYWIVGVSETYQQLRCVPCKGSRFPPTLPRPAVTVLPFHLALCEDDTEKSQYEEQYLRSSLFSQFMSRLPEQGEEIDGEVHWKVLRPVQEALMKLFALSVRSEREFRAMEVCHLMTEERTLFLAAKYASRQHRSRLAQRINHLVQQRFWKAEEQLGGDGEKDGLTERDRAVSVGESVVLSSTHFSSRPSTNEDEQGESLDGQMASSSSRASRVKLKENSVKRPPFGRSNPFTVSQEIVCDVVKGTKVFDAMSNGRDPSSSIRPLPVTNKRPASSCVNAALSRDKPSQQSILSFTAGIDAARVPMTDCAMVLGTNGAGVPVNDCAMVMETDGAMVTETDSANLPILTSHSQHSECNSGICHRPITAFELWMKENVMVDTVSSSPSQGELSQVDCVELFSSLPTEERRQWLQKAKNLKHDEKGAEKKYGQDDEEEECMAGEASSKRMKQ